MTIKSIIFDLDGTLINSAPAILRALKNAFESCQVEPEHDFVEEIIGPPLYTILAWLVGSDDQLVLNSLAKQFKINYDEKEYQKTTVYDGIPEMLGSLKEQGYSLYIATNKRILPTGRIIDFLSWNKFFDGIFALDSFNPPFASKNEMLSDVLQQISVDAQQALYVGDRLEDGAAAKVNNIPFLFAAWGYATVKNKNFNMVENPDELPALISQIYQR
jgi:phosphoglycolate phosphatase